MNEIMLKMDGNITDFFDRIIMAMNLKVEVIRKHPATLSYLNSVYYETDEEVREGIEAIMSEGDAFRQKVAFEGMDYSKFKQDVDVKLIMKMLVWISEGFINPVKSLREEDLDKVCNEFCASLELLRKNLYKEEFV